MPHRVLVIEDEIDMQFTLKEALGRRGYQVECAGDASSGLEALKRSNFDLVLLDVRLPDSDGIALIPSLLEIDPQVVVIVMTAYGSRRLAMEAIQAGAYDFFTKPFHMDEMHVVIRRAIEKRQLTREIRELEQALNIQHDFKNIIGVSSSMQEVLQLVAKVTNTDVTVLITGESGTGKELVAEAIHYHSHRKDQPFVKLNCVAIPDGLLESELFGHEKGAFTGASGRRLGKFELANHGTIFLDEIGDMNLMTQAKILRVLQEREFERVGGSETIQIDTRVIAATNRDLSKAVEDGSFREDLYFRLNVVNIYIPPLRARKEDIPLLVDHFIQLANKKFHRDVQGIAPDALDILMNYSWPGNIRELMNCIERAVVLSDEPILTPRALPSQIFRPMSTGTPPHSLGTRPFKELMAEIEKQIIIDALSRTHGVQARAAKLLGMPERSIWHLVKKHQIDVNEFK